MRLIIAVIPPDPDSFVRLPGAFRRVEVVLVVPTMAEVLLTPAGRGQDGERLYAIHIPSDRTGGRGS